MRIISYSIEVDDVQDVKHFTPVSKYCGTYPSEALKTPQELAQSIVAFLNEEFDLHLVVKVDTASILKELIP